MTDKSASFDWGKAIDKVVFMLGYVVDDSFYHFQR